MSSDDPESGFPELPHSHVMGAGPSKHTRGLVVSLDALGTLYRFREPVTIQYSKVARQCGFKGEYTNDQLDASFRSAFKEQNKLFPNYGKDELPGPQVWWERLVENSFKPFATAQAPLPAETGQKLYEHFASGEAYELFEDVRPFMETISELKKAFADPEGPVVLTGVITNSDPRVRNVLTSLGMRVGASQAINVNVMDSMKEAWQNASDLRVKTPVNDLYNSGDHFNFLATSYDSGHEKPDPHIFADAEILARQMMLSRIFQANERPGSLKEAWAVVGKAKAAPKSRDQLWIHIGDDYEKDYGGARDWDLQALLIDREGLQKDKENVVTSLDDAGKAISIMAQDFLRSQS